VQRTSAVPRCAADPRCAAGDDVAGEMPDDCKRLHGGEIYAAACRGRRTSGAAATAVASTNEAAKLGMEAPMPPLGG